MIKETSKTHESVLRFEAVTRNYGQGVTLVEALKKTSFSIRETEMVAVMGPSGSGKSTLLGLAGVMDRATSGKVFLSGRDVSQLSPRQLASVRRKDIGYIFQDFNLLPGLTAQENVSLPMELDGVSRKAARLMASEALAKVEIEELVDRFPEEMSGGQQQRVAIARAFVGTRSLLLADEPTGALDSMTGDVVMRLLREQCDQGKSALLVTHNAMHAAWADRVLFIKDGAIVDESAGETVSKPTTK